MSGSLGAAWVSREKSSPPTVAASRDVPCSVRPAWGDNCLPDFDNIIDNHPIVAILKDSLISELSAHQQRWEEADRLFGYSSTLQEEEAAAALSEREVNA